MRASSFKLAINQADFDLFKKVLAVIYKDLAELLKTHPEVEIRVDRESIKYNDFKLDFEIESNEVVKFLFNLYYFINKNHQLFTEEKVGKLLQKALPKPTPAKGNANKDLKQDAIKQHTGDNWQVQYSKLVDAIKKSQHRKPVRNAFWG